MVSRACERVRSKTMRARTHPKKLALWASCEYAADNGLRGDADETAGMVQRGFDCRSFLLLAGADQTDLPGRICRFARHAVRMELHRDCQLACLSGGRGCAKVRQDHQREGPPGNKNRQPALTTSNAGLATGNDQPGLDRTGYGFIPARDRISEKGGAGSGPRPQSIHPAGYCGRPSTTKVRHFATFSRSGRSSLNAAESRYARYFSRPSHS
jgi:hypothetical protein